LKQQGGEGVGKMPTPKALGEFIFVGTGFAVV